MKLSWSSTSPFARKVVVLAHEVGLASRIEIVPVATSPLSPDAGLMAQNPLAKIPALTTDDGVVLYDSWVICEYLDSLHDGELMVPRQGPARFRVLTLQALGDGVLDAGILVRYEHVFRAEGKVDEGWVAGQARKVMSGLDALEVQVASFSPRLDLGQIAVVCALGWLEFRAPIAGIRERRPRLFAWYDEVKTRPSFASTLPG